LLKTDLRSERFFHSIKQSLERILSSKLDKKRLQRERTGKAGNGPVVPVNEQVFTFLMDEKSTGRAVILDTTEDPQSIDTLLADRNIFNQTVDLSSDLKSEQQFDYIGSSHTPDSVWDNANKRYLVGKKQDSQDFNRVFSNPPLNLAAILHAIRAYQWLKNLLVFVPLITSQRFNDGTALIDAFIMFLCYSAVASFGYIMNDLLDLQSDRAHPTKRKRPFASGRLTPPQGLLIGAALLVCASIGCFFLPPLCSFALLAYLALTLSYSAYLKTKLMIDVVALGGLFTLRVIGGGAAIQTELSFYLLSFSIFLFSSLAMLKRFAELHNLQSRNKLAAHGRGYRVEDIEPVRIIGISLGYISVFIMGLYINSPLVTEFYRSPMYIWCLLPLLTYWLGRLWILANRGLVNEDPLLFAVKDRTSILVGSLAGSILIFAN